MRKRIDGLTIFELRDLSKSLIEERDLARDELRTLRDQRDAANAMIQQLMAVIAGASNEF